MSLTTTTVVENTEGEPAPTPAARVRPPTMTTDHAIERFIALRDKVAAIKKAHQAELAPYNGAMATLEAWLIGDLNTARVNSMGAPGGTIYKSTRTSATVQDWQETLKYIQQRDAWELLERRVSKTAVEAIIEDTKAAPPGVKISREVVLNVRKS